MGRRGRKNDERGRGENEEEVEGGRESKEIPLFHF